MEREKNAWKWQRRLWHTFWTSIDLCTTKKATGEAKSSNADVMVSGCTSTEAIMLQNMMTGETIHYLQIHDSSEYLTVWVLTTE
jgi:hypothetical protein